MKILLLEPDTLLGGIYKTALESVGCNVFLYKNAEQAIRSIDRQAPDLIILELQLVRHNGIEFLYELRSYSDWRDLPVIVLSQVPPHESGLDPGLQERLGILKYCYKPKTSLTQLTKFINQLIPFA